MDVRVGIKRKLSTEELMLLNCGVGEEIESPLDCREIQLVYPKGNQSWIFTGRTDAAAETSIPWPPDAKNLLIGKDPDAGKDWRREEKRTTEDEMVGWHHWNDGHWWVGSRSWWWTGNPGMLQSMESQRVEPDWATELNWTELMHLFSLVQSLSPVRLFVTPRTAACQASLSISNSRSLLKLMSFESVMPSNHLILCCPLFLPPSIFPSIRVF